MAPRNKRAEKEDGSRKDLNMQSHARFTPLSGLGLEEARRVGCGLGDCNWMVEQISLAGHRKRHEQCLFSGHWFSAEIMGTTRSRDMKEEKLKHAEDREEYTPFFQRHPLCPPRQAPRAFPPHRAYTPPRVPLIEHTRIEHACYIEHVRHVEHTHIEHQAPCSGCSERQQTPHEHTQGASTIV